MKYRLALGLLATIVLACPPARAVNQGEINRAIERGVKALHELQRPDGTWPHQFIGATALAGLTLLECGAKEDDNDVLSAADAVRKASVSLTHTYSISLSIMFLDRLGDKDDVPFIESLTKRLLAGQDAASGGWNYDCPAIGSSDERQLLMEKLNKRKRADAPRPEPRRRFDNPGFGPFQGGAAGPIPMMVGGGGDNSNTQFAALGLWVGHRHGVSIDRALDRLAQRFRSTQTEDGGWTYQARPAGMPAHVPLPFGMGTTATMTCAGLICLAIADGASLERAQKRKPDAKLPDISKDKHLSKGLEALGAVIGDPKGKGIKPQRPAAPFGPPGAMPFPPANGVGGKTYYFLWSLERVAVALDLQTIGKKDWYSWGAEILLENQMPDGTWNGTYGPGGVDTCFALLFLKRANLVRDLTANIKGKITDPAERELRGGKIVSRGQTKILPGIESGEAKPIEKPLLKATRTESVQLADKLVKAVGPERDTLLEKMETGKGVKYTEALAEAIPKLEGETKSKAREALANRLTRMKDETLESFFEDSDPEIRRAAAIAAGQKDSNGLVPKLIALLRDPEFSVVRAARAALKALTDQDFGPATAEEREQAVQKWSAWWTEKRKK